MAKGDAVVWRLPELVRGRRVSHSRCNLSEFQRSSILPTNVPQQPRRFDSRQRV